MEGGGQVWKIMFSFTSCHVYWGKRWQQDALWENGKPVEAVWYSRKTWVLAFIWMLFIHVPPTYILTQTMYTLSWQHLMTEALSYIIHTATLQKLFRNSWKNDKEFRGLIWSPSPPFFSLTEHLWNCREKQVRTMEVPPHNFNCSDWIHC